MNHFNHENLTSDDRVAERKQMVEKQLISRGIKNETVLKSMLEVPRHLFVPGRVRAFAYQDGPLHIGEGQTISQPYIVALMAELLAPAPADRVLEIGTGSGYAAAVLSRMAAKVYTVERLAKLAKKAQARFRTLKYDNIEVRVGDGTRGWPGKAPFDGIMVSAGAPVIPRALREQLQPGGRLVIPVGDKNHQELLLVRHKPEGGFTEEITDLVCFVPLIGREGWEG
jgi:protein-L-isoaspartate(D-aspartate) O-methyltransferase